MGTPTGAGSYTLVLRVDDSAGLFATRELTVTIAGPQERGAVDGGCGCAAGGESPASLFWLASLGLAFFRRRTTR